MVYFAVLPRKVAGVIFCCVGALAIIGGIFGGNKNDGPVVLILVGSLFGGLGSWLIKASMPNSDRHQPVEDGTPRGTRCGDIAEQSRPEAARQNPNPTSQIEAAGSQEPAAQDAGVIAASISKLIGDAFSCAHYLELFGDQNFPSEWTVQDGLAVWYFFGAVALDVTVFSAIPSREQSSLFRDICDRLLSKQWRMPEPVLERFNNYMERHGAQAFIAFSDCKSPEDLHRYFSRCVNRILGAELPFDPKGSTIDLIAAGHKPKTFDVALGTGFGGLFLQSIDAARMQIKGANISWPAPAARA